MCFHHIQAIPKMNHHHMIRFFPVPHFYKKHFLQVSLIQHHILNLNLLVQSCIIIVYLLKWYLYRSEFNAAFLEYSFLIRDASECLKAKGDVTDVNTRLQSVNGMEMLKITEQYVNNPNVRYMILYKNYNKSVRVFICRKQIFTHLIYGIRMYALE